MRATSLMKVTAVLGFLIGAAAGFISVSPAKEEVLKEREKSKEILPPELKHRKPHPVSPSHIAGRVKVKDVGVSGSGAGGGESQSGGPGPSASGGGGPGAGAGVSSGPG
ncbi:MAG: hypothetical protein ABGY09_00460 [Euryarchaeota archaeon]